MNKIIFLSIGFIFCVNCVSERSDQFLREFNEREQLLISNAKKKTPKAPLLIYNNQITYNSIGIPELTVWVYNNSNRNIDAYRISCVCVDGFDRPVKKYNVDSALFVGVN